MRAVFSIVIISCVVIRLHGSIVSSHLDKQISDVAIALSEIINGLKPTSLTILFTPSSLKANQSYSVDTSSMENDDNIHKHVDDFIYQLHKLYFKSVIFYDVELFFQYIESMLQGSIESVNLIFCQPYELSVRIQERKLSHRLSLFIFYWGAKYPPKASEVRFEEPIRAVVITRPRKKAFRIYYNQAVPDGNSNLRLVNWYDADNLGLQKVPLLPNAASVYSNFNGRVFRVPVFHSPPWFWVNYENETSNLTFGNIDDFSSQENIFNSYDDFVEVNVSGGRDHRLLNLLAKQMNFQYVYIEAPGRTQGSMRLDAEANESFTGGIRLLQLGVADFLLGDVSLSWERRKAVEFSFFTLADSGAFATHAPRRLNEAFAIIRPFKLNVWPYLIVTVILSGPIFYAIIAIPYKWNLCDARKRSSDSINKDESPFYMAYIKEITIHNEVTRRLACLQLAAAVKTDRKEPHEMPKDLLSRCIWFTVQLFLKQSCKELYHGYRAKFLMIVYCIAATYVLADVYSAQLTSQFARPAHEAPINNLQRLQKAMLQDGYQLYVEKESSSLEMLENGTEIFRQLFALMKHQNMDEEVEEGYLIDSVEAGLQLIADGLENKAVLGGRETLYFNIQQFGSKSFQLSQKLYTRYSAVAVQIGCPFLDSLNDVIIHLFEGGILDKMTSAEYETQSRLIALNSKQPKGSAHQTASSSASAEPNSKDEGNQDSSGKGTQSSEVQKSAQMGGLIHPLNLRMLQGAFIVLVFGYGTAGVVFLLELIVHRLNCDFWQIYRQACCAYMRLIFRRICRILRLAMHRMQN